MEKNKEWSNDEMFLLIDVYKEKPCLWDPTHKEYKLKTKRTDCWIEIANIFNCEVNIVRKKMESLLTSFRRERQRCEETKKSGIGSDEIYSSTWFAFGKMKFLLDKFSPRPTQDTMDDSNETQDNILSRDSDDSASSTNKIFKSPKKLKRGKYNTFDERAEEAYNIMQEAVKRRNDRDQSTTFGEHVANKHRSYSSRTKCIVEHLIANTLFEADIGKYENYPLISPTSNYSQEPYYISQSPVHSDSTTPTSPFPDNQPPSRTPTPTLPCISTQTSTQRERTSSTPLPNSQSLVKQYDREPKLVKTSKSSSSGVSGSGSRPKKVTVLRSLIIKRPKHNSQNIPPNEQCILPEDKYISPKEKNIVPRIDPSFIHGDFANISQQQNTDNLVSFINNFIPK